MARKPLGETPGHVSSITFSPDQWGRICQQAKSNGNPKSQATVVRQAIDFYFRYHKQVESIREA